MNMAKKKNSAEDAFYSVVCDPRRKQEVMDSKMISYDQGDKAIYRVFNPDKFGIKFSYANNDDEVK